MMIGRFVTGCPGMGTGSGLIDLLID